jgi:hypothetical protein
MLPHVSLLCRRRKPAVETCVDNTAKLKPQASFLALRRQHRDATAAGIGLGTTAMCMQRTTSGAAGNGLYTTNKYMRGAVGIGLGTTIKYLRRTTSAAANNGLSTTAKYLLN